MQKLPNRVEIYVPGRLHLGLIGMGETGPRINGGLGFALAEPCLKISAEPSSDFELIDNRLYPLSGEEQDAVRALVKNNCVQCRSGAQLRITISGNLPSHFGFGAGTAIRLAVLEAVHTAHGVPLEPEALIAQSRRGGTSGVGIRTYFEGGLTFDLGQPGTRGHQPSHRCMQPTRPLQLARTAMPPWCFGICVPTHLEPLTHEQECAVFVSTTPVPAADVYITLWHALCGVFAAAAEGDLDTFCRSIDALQQSAWKRAEWQAHGSHLKDLAQELRDAGAAGVGLSSMGPTLFFSAETFESGRLREKLRSTLLFTNASNSGRKVVAHAIAFA
jgi:beta-ribofuranosylaminobenzene 5'-phosphate synthase